jgi:hypothetical protein
MNMSQILWKMMMPAMEVTAVLLALTAQIGTGRGGFSGGT